MLKKIVMCFLALCCGLILAFFICFRLLILPRYNDYILNEARLTTNMISELMQNTIERSMNTINAEIINKQYSLLDLSQQEKIEIPQALDSLQFLDNKIEQFNLFYTVDIYFEHSQSVMSSAFGLKPTDSKDTRKWFPWLVTDNFDNFAAGQKRVHAYTITSFYNEKTELVSFSQVLRIPVANGISRCIINYGIRRSNLLRLLHLDSSKSDSSIFLSDSCGNLIELVGNKLEAVVAAGLQEKLLKADSIRFMDSTLLICHAENSGQAFQLLKLLPTATISDSLQELNRLFLIALALILVLSMLFGYFASIRIYRPFKKLITQIQKKYAGADPASFRTNNDLRFLSQVVQSLFVQVDFLEGALRENRLIARSHLLLGLLNGSISERDEIHNKMSLCDLSFPYAKYAVLLLHFEPSVFSGMLLQEFQLVKVEIMNLLTQVRNENCCFFPVETDEYELSAIINFNTPDLHSAVIRSLSSATDLHKLQGGAIIFSVGQETDGLESVFKSYQTAQVSSAYRFLYPKQELFFYDLLQIENRHCQLPVELLAGIRLAFQNNNCEEAADLLMEMIQTIKHTPYQAGYILSLLSSLARQFTETLPPDMKKELNLVHWNPFTFNTIDELEVSVHQVLLALQHYRDTLKENKRQIIIQAVCNYIDTHLDSSLALSEVARQVYLSPAYLSKTFKEVTGINFNEYINKSKMVAAQKALLTSNDNVETISQKLGFTSANYFIKRFKQFCGLTPTAYRTHHITE